MRKRLNTGLLFFVIFSIIILFLSRTTVFSGITGFIQNIFSTPKLFLYSFNIKLSNPFNIFNTEDYKKLEDQNREILSRLVEYNKIKKDNIVLKEQFENGSIKSKNLILAQVIGFLGRHDLPQGLIINKGENEGVKKGAGVIINNNFVGKVTKTSKTFSRILLPTDREFSIVVKDISSGATGIIRGEEDFVLIDKVVITDQLKKNDIIVTKGDVDKSGTGVPPDYLIGTISSVNKAENKPFQNAKIEPILDYSKLETVFVVETLE